MRDRVYLFGRRLTMFLRFRREFDWSPWVCWQMAKLNQRHVLQIIAAVRADDMFEAEVLADLNRLPVCEEVA